MNTLAYNKLKTLIDTLDNIDVYKANKGELALYMEAISIVKQLQNEKYTRINKDHS